MPAIEPLGEARSNWDVMRALARGMGYEEPWLQSEIDEIIEEVLEATARTNPYLEGITLERLQTEGAIPLAIPEEERIPFARHKFSTPSGKVEFYSEQAAANGYDPVPGWVPEQESHIREDAIEVVDERLPLVSAAAHHFISSSFANVETLKAKERVPRLTIHPRDAEKRGIRSGQLVRVGNERGWCQLVAEVSEGVREGVLSTPTVWWPKFSPDQRNINWTTSDRLADFNGGSTFYTNMVLVEPAKEV
ncbi:molybdopterin dinucleotide binding domain-containing protein [Ktedonospora formicarum]